MSADLEVCHCGGTLTEEPDDQYGTVWRCPAGHIFAEEEITPLEKVAMGMLSVAMLTALITSPAAPAMLDQVAGAMRTASTPPSTEEN